MGGQGIIGFLIQQKEEGEEGLCGCWEVAGVTVIELEGEPSR